MAGTQNMEYRDLFTPYHIAVLVDWLEEKRELCVEIYTPHSASGPSYYTAHPMSELKSLIQAITSPELQMRIWRHHNQSEFQSDESGELEALASNLKWIYSHADEVMYFSVQKNRNRSESYADHPEKYAKHLEEWAS